jgi:hypothetical protein
MVTKKKVSKETKAKAVKSNRSTKGGFLGLSLQNPVEFHKPVIKGTKQQQEMRNLKKQLEREQSLTYKTRKLNTEAAYWGALAKKKAAQRAASSGGMSLGDILKPKRRRSRKLNIMWI